MSTDLYADIAKRGYAAVAKDALGTKTDEIASLRAQVAELAAALAGLFAGGFIEPGTQEARLAPLRAALAGVGEAAGTPITLDFKLRMSNEATRTAIERFKKAEAWLVKWQEFGRVSDESVGKWLSAALDDPAVCAEMKADIQAWFDAFAKAETK